MRILQVGKYSRERSGGVETAVYGLCAELAKDHDVELLVASAGGPGLVERQGRLTCRVLPVWLTFASTPVVPSLAAELRRAGSFDVLQVSLQNPMAVLACLLARPRCRLVAWYHHDIVRQRRLGALFSPLQRAFLRRADAVVATSAEYAESSDALREFRDKVRVIPLGIDADAAAGGADVALTRSLRERLGAPLVGFVGRLVYYKGLPTLLEAMRGLDARLLIVGRGPLERELRAQAARLGVADRVAFEDVPHGRPIAPYWAACDVAVLPSTERTEAFGLSLLEAMACGLPVVATRLGTGTTLVCEDGVNGLCVPPGDAAALREALGRLLADGTFARRLGAAGREKVRARFSLSAMTRSFVELYRELSPAC